MDKDHEIESSHPGAEPMPPDIRSAAMPMTSTVRVRLFRFCKFWASFLYLLLPTSIIFTMAILIPNLLVVWGWTKEFQDISNMFILGNQKHELYQFALILIPICAVYLATAIVFLTEAQSRDHKFHPVLTTFSFTIPGLMVTMLFLMLGHYSQERPTSPFDGSKLFEFKAVFWATVTFIFLMDAFMVLSRKYNAT